MSNLALVCSYRFNITNGNASALAEKLNDLFFLPKNILIVHRNMQLASFKILKILSGLVHDLCDLTNVNPIQSQTKANV